MSVSGDRSWPSLTRSFAGRAAESLGPALPIFFDEDNLKYWSVAVAGSRIVAATGAHIFAVRAGPFSYQAAHIGAVCTLPKWRGQGIASRLLDFQADLLRSCQIDVGFISGRRPLYARAGATEAGTMCWRRLPAYESSAAPVRPLTDDDLPELYRLWAMEPISIERTPATWALGLKAVPDRLGWRRAVAVAGHPARAYVVVDAGPTGSTLISRRWLGPGGWRRWAPVMSRPNWAAKTSISLSLPGILGWKKKRQAPNRSRPSVLCLLLREPLLPAPRTC